MFDNITDVQGIRVGHYTDLEAATGCTVILCEKGAIGGVDARGAAPGTRETDLLRPMHLVQEANAILLSGGSAFGLDAATGVMRYLEEKGQGFKVGSLVVPIVPAAVLFDLDVGNPAIRPNAEAGYKACASASEGPVEEGSVGAGTGATVGKLLGPRYAMKGGLGTASRRIGKGITVAALVAVNALGDVVDPQTGKILAGTRKPVAGGFLDSQKSIQGELVQRALGFTSTTIGVVATDAGLTKEEANKLAQLAYNGYARVLRPITMFDGDVVFALSCGKKKGDLSAIGAAAADVVAEAIVRAVKKAKGLRGVPAYGEVK